jgi:hypothetical protein
MSGGSMAYNHAIGLPDGTLGRGGGIYVFSGGDLSLTNVSITNNSAEGPNGGRGGGFYIRSGPVTFTTCPISGNSAALGPGGAYKNVQDFVNNGCTITDALALDP